MLGGGGGGGEAEGFYYLACIKLGGRAKTFLLMTW